MKTFSLYGSRGIEDALQEIALEETLKTGSLNLKACRLMEIPPALLRLTHLTKLDLTGNQLSVLPPEFDRLTQLKELRLAGNAFEDVPTVLLRLYSLEVLDIGLNKLRDLPGGLVNLRGLTYLRIGGNPFPAFPEVVSTLSSLITLIANDLRLSEFPSQVANLSNLRVLNLADNNFNQIPPEFTRLKNLREFYVKQDVLSSPPIEIVARGPQAIINYLHAFDKDGETFCLREAKLIIVGPGAVGKTHLLKRLVYDQVDPETFTTEGIDIARWDLPILEDHEFRVNVWDFGGQEIYHATHQFFLTKRSLYIFVWDARKEENVLNFDYWFSIIRLLSDSSPVLVVQNKVDERIKMIDEESLRDKFKNIHSFHRVSALTGKGIPDLREAIAGQVPFLEHVGDVLPKAWIDIRHHLESLPEDFISFTEYLDACAAFGMDEEKATYLSQYYHDLGVVLHFQDSPVLREIVFLNPEWATNAVYKLIDTKEVQTSYGRFSFDQLRSVWSEYPRERYVHLVELMKRFELCFQVRDTEDYIIPELLNARRPEFYWDAKRNLHFHYRYEFMPAGILTRFIVRTQDLTKGDIYWKNGVVLRSSGTEALIIAEPLRRRITCQIRGNDCGALLAIIRREIEYIHKTLNSPEVTEELPCTCRDCVRSDEPYMHSFEYLRRARARRKWTVECKVSLDDVRIDDILGEIQESDRNDYSGRHMHGPIGNQVTISNVITIGSINIRKQYSGHLAEYADVSQEDFNRILTAIASLPTRESEELGEIVAVARQDPESDGAIGRIQEFAARHSIPVVQGLSSSALFELVKFLFV